MKINNIEFEFDIYDVDQAGNFEKALDQLSESEKDCKAAASTKKMTEMNLAFIGMFRKFFLKATGVDVLKDCKNARVAEQSYLEFLDEIGKMKGQLFGKYNTNRVR